MKRRRLGAGLLVMASSMLLLVGTASAHGSATPAGATTPGTCTIKSLPFFVAQGEFGTTATVADVIEIGCDPVQYGTGSTVKVTASQLNSLCNHDLTWYVPNPYRVVSEAGSGVQLTLDPDGNATVALIAGPQCAAGESLVTVHELDEPFESFTTVFQVLPPNDTTEGVFALPATQIEDAESSAVATVIEAEFPNASEKKLRIGSEELFARCRKEPHTHWITENRTETSDTGEVNRLELDNNGNTFVVAIGDSSCFPGASLIEADLESKPFTTLTTDFTIQSPKPRA